MNRVSVLALAAALVAAPAAAQPPKPVFTPTVGQAGKDVVWVPTDPELVEKMLDLARVTADDFVVDLGSGDGRNIIAAAKRGARGLGVEYNPDMVELSRRLAADAGVADKATFVQGDMYEADISRATALALFLLPANMDRLVPKFLALRPGTRIVANTFAPSEWEPDQREVLDSASCSTWCEALLWIVPARAGGAWRLADGATLALEQSFQRLSGTVTAGGASTPIVNGRLRGEEITFDVGGARYTGRVVGDTMEGTVRSGRGDAAFRATRSDRQDRQVGYVGSGLAVRPPRF
jgi:SAM-dependent methyltransferase